MILYLIWPDNSDKISDKHLLNHYMFLKKNYIIHIFGQMRCLVNKWLVLFLQLLSLKTYL